MSVRYQEWDVIEGNSEEVEALANELVYTCFLRKSTVDERLNPVIKSEAFTGRVFVEDDFARTVVTYEKGEVVNVNTINEF